MNAEILHDALNLLPEDLIAETDALRQAKKPNIIPWKRILPIAACLCLILLTAPTMLALMAPKGAKEMAQDCAPAEGAPTPSDAPIVLEKGAEREDTLLETPADEIPMPKIGAVYGLTAHYIPTQLCDAGISRKITVIASRPELDDYLAQCNALYFDDALENACAGYGDDYFADNQLVILLTAEDLPTASYSGNVLLPIQSGNWSVSWDGEAGWVIEVGDMVHDLSTAQQHILLEVPDLHIEPDAPITLVQTPKED